MIESRIGNMYNGLVDMIKFINSVLPTKEMSILEVGSYKGDSARIFSKHFLHVYCVDAWEKELFNVPNTNVSDAETQFNIVALEHYDNIEKLKGRSINVAKTFGSLKVDVIYIDASHDYESVKADILAWKDKARHFICGHDYWVKKFPGVIMAVNEILGKPITFSDTSWLVHV